MLPTAQKELVKKLTDEWASGNGPRMSGNRRVLRALEAAYEVFKSKTPSIGEERRALSQAQAQKSVYSTNEAGRAPADAEAARVSVLSKLRAAAESKKRSSIDAEADLRALFFAFDGQGLSHSYSDSRATESLSRDSGTVADAELRLLMADETESQHGNEDSAILNDLTVFGVADAFIRDSGERELQSIFGFEGMQAQTVDRDARTRLGLYDTARIRHYSTAALRNLREYFSEKEDRLSKMIGDARFEKVQYV